MTQKDSENSTQRIAKWLARAGVASRRGAEQLIAEGKVSVNGKKLTSPALNVKGDEDIRVEGRRIGEPEPPRLWRLYKKPGLITTTSDPEGRPNVFNRLPAGLPRVMSVGRLDINTEGLLLLTNDGDMARLMELPATGWSRRYRVRAYGSVTQQQLDRLEKGITVDGVRYGPITAKLEKQQRGNVWLSMILREGKTREIKNVLGTFDLQVNRLIRVSFGPFTLQGLEPGDVKEVQRKILRDQLGPEWEARLISPYLVRRAQSNQATGDEPKGPPSHMGAQGGKPDRKPAGRSGAKPGGSGPGGRSPGGRGPGAKGPGGRPDSKGSDAKGPGAKGPGGRPGGRGSDGKGPGGKGPGGRGPGGKGPGGKGPGGKPPSRNRTQGKKDSAHAHHRRKG